MTHFIEPVFGEPFDSARQLLARANEHIAELEKRAGDALRSGRHWVDVGDPNAEGRRSLTLQYDIQLPGSLSSIANDCAANLRSALDHAVYASVQAISGGDPTDTKFPFGDTVEQMRGQKCGALHPQVLRVIQDEIQPFRDGNPALWGLNKLRNRKGHRVLSAMATIGNLQELKLEVPAFQQASFRLVLSDWQFFNDRLFIGDVVGTAKVDLHFKFGVGLCGVHGFEKPASMALREFAAATTVAVNQIETATAFQYSAR